MEREYEALVSVFSNILCIIRCLFWVIFLPVFVCLSSSYFILFKLHGFFFSLLVDVLNLVSGVVICSHVIVCFHGILSFDIFSLCPPLPPRWCLSSSPTASIYATVPCIKARIGARFVSTFCASVCVSHQVVLLCPLKYTSQEKGSERE